MYARLHASPRLCSKSAPAAATRPEPYDRSTNLVDLDVVIESLGSHGAGALAEAHVVPVRQAVATFGAHLCGLDVRQNSAVHETVIADLLAAATDVDYLALAEAERVEVLSAELRSARVLRTPWASYTDTTRAELDVLDEVAGAVRRHGPKIVTHYVISKAESVSDTTSMPRSAMARVCPALSDA
jgi:phosphoenolpyruvate carboxylase